VLKKGLASLSPYLRMMLLSVMKPLPCRTQHGRAIKFQFHVKVTALMVAGS
jgi:hypothetical protein